MILDENGNPIVFQETLVRQFRTAFGASKSPALWEKLIEEECNEFDEALEHLLKEFTDVHYVVEGYAQVMREQGIEDFPEALAQRSMLIANLMSAIFTNEATDEAFRRVHASNMSKLDDNGNPVVREDGKILKSANYKPADLSDLTSTKVS